MTKRKQYRTFNFDGDFRRQPKTDQFCAICQKDIAAPKYFAYLAKDPSSTIVHPNDLTGDELVVPVGSECRRKVPDEFVIQCEFIKPSKKVQS